jgi:hypothetical protein
VRQSLLTPRDQKLLVRYLDAVDSAVAGRLLTGFSPHEDHLTALLCELLDSQHSPLHALSYTFETLKADLAADSKAIDVSLKLETRKYPPHIERHLTSSDLGIIVEYRDYLGGSAFFDRGALFQAKRLYAQRAAYTLEDQFREFDAEQLARLVALEADESLSEGDERHFHPDHDWCYYLFYCPSASGYDDRSRELVRRLILPNDNIFDHSKGWHLYEYASSPTRQIPGLVVSRLAWLTSIFAESGPGARKRTGMKPTARQVFEQFWDGAQPLSWFMVYDLLSGRAGTGADAALHIIRGQAPPRDAPVPLPRYVLTVRVQAGQG